jgi:DNA polymerase I
MSESATPSRRLLLVDGHAYAYRAYHAIRSLSGPGGEPTNAIFGFVKMLLKLRATLQPEAVIVVWDGGLAPERMAALPDYKQNRPPTPDALASQLPQLEEWLDAIGWPQWVQDETEADDWLATFARRAEVEGWLSVIASSDKDFMQLVGDRVLLFNPGDKTEKLWTAADVEAKTGVGPSQIVDYLSLIGDAVDNIPGVTGVGPKTAADLLRRFGSIDGILPRLHEVKSDKLRAELAGAAEALRRNQFMVRLKDDLQGGPSPGEIIFKTPDPARLRDMYRRWGFRGLLAELESPSLEELLSAPVGVPAPKPPSVLRTPPSAESRATGVQGELFD